MSQRFLDNLSSFIGKLANDIAKVRKDIGLKDGF